MATKQIYYQKERIATTLILENLLYREMCMEEYKANIEGTLDSFMTVSGPVYFELIHLFTGDQSKRDLAFTYRD